MAAASGERPLEADVVAGKVASKNLKQGRIF